MKFPRKFVALSLAFAMVTLGGCELRRKPNIPQQATAPTKLPEPEGPKPVTPEPVQQPVVVDTTPAQTETATVTKPKPKPTKRVARKVVPAEPAPSSQQPPAGGGQQKPPDVQITAELPRSAALRQNTGQLLDATEANLKKINRSLNDSEQAMVRQIRTYITQAKLAVNDGDLERANILANKANQLSNELVK